MITATAKRKQTTAYQQSLEDNYVTSISVAAEECAAFGQRQQVVESFPGRDTNLGRLKILRALPIKGKRLVGPWCFLDRYGPYAFTGGKPMDVAPHPHIGLQTVTWLLEGEIVHNDSLGCEGLIRPGGVNVMTAGNGIAHAEETPRNNSGVLNALNCGWRCRKLSGRSVRHFNTSSKSRQSTCAEASRRSSQEPWRELLRLRAITLTSSERIWLCIQAQN
jgi:Pirin